MIPTSQTQLKPNNIQSTEVSVTFWPSSATAIASLACLLTFDTTYDLPETHLTRVMRMIRLFVWHNCLFSEKGGAAPAADAGKGDKKAQGKGGKDAGGPKDNKGGKKGE